MSFYAPSFSRGIAIVGVVEPEDVGFLLSSKIRFSLCIFPCQDFSSYNWLSSKHVCTTYPNMHLPAECVDWILMVLGINNDYFRININIDRCYENTLCSLARNYKFLCPSETISCIHVTDFNGFS